jgi:hypothetical protein
MSIHGLGTIQEITDKITADRVLLLAGEEALLAQLPAGRWIGATSANFMTATGGLTDRTHIFYTDITDLAQSVEIRSLDATEISTIAKSYPENGFTILIVPGLSKFLGSFAQNVQDFEGIFNAPLIGWMSGVHPSEIGQKTPKTFAGLPKPEAERAAVMYVTLPQHLAASLDIINLFSPGKGAAIQFLADGLSSEGDVLIDGKPTPLAAYIAAAKIDTKLPLVADYNGAMINVSIQSIDTESQKVSFFAPVFKSMTYHFASPVPDYTAAFAAAIRGLQVENAVFSCNCILNFLYANLEGKSTAPFIGPVTFGEIAYIVLNQTMAYLSVVNVDEPALADA